MLDRPMTSTPSSSAMLPPLPGLSQAGIDHFKPGISESANDHLRPLVMAIQARLGDQHFEGCLAIHFESSFAMINFKILLVPPPIRVKRTSRR